jgi:cold shock CspA family protein
MTLWRSHFEKYWTDSEQKKADENMRLFFKNNLNIFQKDFRISFILVPRKGLEPPRSYSLVPETSASTNSATWAFQERGYCIKNMSQTSGLLDEVEGTVQGHRDGHGFVNRDDGESDIYLPPNEMRAVLHKDRVKVRIVRSDRKGDPRGEYLKSWSALNNPSSAACCRKAASGWLRPKTSAMGRM